MQHFEYRLLKKKSKKDNFFKITEGDSSSSIISMSSFILEFRIFSLFSSNFCSIKESKSLISSLNLLSFFFSEIEVLIFYLILFF